LYFSTANIFPVGKVLAVLPERDLLRVSLTKLRRCQEEHFCLAVVEVIDEALYHKSQAQILAQRLHDYLEAAFSRRSQVPETVWMVDIDVNGNALSMSIEDCGSHLVAHLAQSGLALESHQIPSDFWRNAGFSSLNWTSDKAKEMLYLLISTNFYCDDGRVKFVANDPSLWHEEGPTTKCVQFEATIDGKDGRQRAKEAGGYLFPIEFSKGYHTTE
jgi:hypothetical protein